MEFHRLLEEQIKKHLKKDRLSDPDLNNFIRAVNESYHSFEKNKNSDFPQNSIEQIYRSCGLIDENIKNADPQDSSQLIRYFSQQIQKRKNAEAELNEQNELKKLLMNISSEYINISFEKIGSAMNSSLQEMADFVKADRAYVFAYNFEDRTCSNTYEYCASGIIPQIEELQHIPLDAIPEWVEAHLAGKSITIPDVNALPEGHLKDLLSSQDIKSLLVIPMILKENCIGFIGFDSVKTQHHYSKTETELLTLFSKVLVNAQERFSIKSNLTKTLELLKIFITNLHYGILIDDSNRRILFTNDLFCEIFGIHTSSNEITGKSYDEVAEQIRHCFQEEHILSEIEHTAQNSTVSGKLVKTVDGRFLEVDYIPIDIKNELNGHIWKFDDITEKICNQNLLQQSEQRNQLIMDSAINAIITVDSTGAIIFWNKSAETIFGWPKNEVIGKNIFEIIIPQKHVENYKNYMDAEKNKVLNKQIQLPAVRKSGEEFPMEISIISFQQQEKEFFCSFIQDISERKGAEHNIRVQEQKYRNMIANMNLGLLEVDMNEVIQYANQSFCNVSGYDLNEIIGRNPAELFLHHEKDIETVKKQISLRRGGISSVYQIPVKNKSGELRWWAISGAPNYDDKGNLIGSIGIHLDVTDQKRLEEDLQKQKEKAQEASKAKEAFLANMSHEIRTPLNAIIGFLRELEKQKLTSSQSVLVENSAHASHHLLSIINNILDISKIEAGEMSLEVKDFSLKDAVNNVINILSPKAKQKKLKLYSQYSSDLASAFKGDQLRIEQILFNLIGNSLKFTHAGEIKIDCILAEDKPSAQKIKLTVSDTGIGMSKGFADKIFKKFYQEDESIARRFGGTGLGMAITQQLIKLMNGKIAIESEKNKGTVIEITLTFPKGHAGNLTRKKNKNHKTSVEGIKVLLVEDNALNRVVAQNSLQHFKCSVTEAENGTEAIAVLKKEKFDIILMDIQMPELDGIETTKILRKEYQLTTPIIALTANAFKSEIENCKSAGMNDYISKPFSEEMLLEVLYKYTKHLIPSDGQNKVSEISADGLYDLSSIRALSRGDDEFIKKMLTIFITQTENAIGEAHSCLTSQNYHEIARLMHKIRPSIEGLGITSIVEDIKLLEAKAKEEPASGQEIAALFGKIEKVLLEVLRLFIKNEL
ncbi:MAG: PAS domain S-box protein [Chryseobacterium sp.]|uniref:PAS domain S-box protein n=1 Tax=Chryseobacterium sp. TaxID=1871047 RepID=UPI0025BAC5F3|nr:PAS domain S-box protein [Chryseobacterium sp.]MCJ7936265.1 PAS domain S-box protein [Chryseobacterium sp.]